MRLQAIVNGNIVHIVDIVRNGSNVYLNYINGSTGVGPLISTVLTTSAGNNPDIVLSTSAVFLA